MKLLLQRVSSAKVEVDSVLQGSIQRGLLVFVGIEKDDTEACAQKMCEKLLAYRVFPDADGKMNLSVSDIAGGVLIVSQFTLAASTKKGLRPSFSSSASPEMAQGLYESFVTMVKARHAVVETGKFAADMQVSLVNDGPVTFLLEL